MSSFSNAQSTEVSNLSRQNGLPAIANLSECAESPLEPEEDEDEDVDFNPFMQGIPSPDASSSLSSEIEGLDGDLVESMGNTFASMGINLSKLTTSEVQCSAVGDSDHGEDESVMQTTISPGGTCEKELETNVSGKLKKRKFVLMSQPEIMTVREKENGSSTGTGLVNDVVAGELSNTQHSRNPIVDIDDKDAICRRTRARYSLTSFTLDELEAFLQETDDYDDDYPNVDDEEEYRKFLAAVLQGGDGDNQTIQENEIVDDEDDNNDADFELEIEEALESDLDESTRDKTKQEDFEEDVRRPKTRQNRRQKASAKNKKKLSGQAENPLRPLLPIRPNALIAPFPGFDRSLMPETASRCLSSSAEYGFVNGFTPHQIGQLHCLIHEHVQLLIQVFSLCVLEPSRKHIASQVQGLILEMLYNLDQVLAWRSVPYPGFCFRPPYIHPSVPNETSKFCPAQCIFESSLTSNAQGDCSSANMPASYIISPSKGRHDYVSNGQVDSFQTTQGSFWVPFISGPVLSILDVAPLNLVGTYMDDVKTAVREYQRRHVEATCDTHFDKEPLFPLPSFPSFSEASGEVLQGTIPPSANTLPSSPSHQPPKKTLAASLVESSKKQPVALVPKEVVKLAQRFFPLFNSELFPRKPPPSGAANRVLFTDAEDELLAMGLMEYNTDWKAIQQRYFPCKSKHQIFVRHKNRCSSKAPENPIKAVRMMKTSPLTADEQARIQEGLGVFKHDWMSIWKFIVPHRDPSLLPRQWRIALGTQKSYKTDAAQKKKRRLYESKRRKCKGADVASWKTVSEKEDYQTENAGGENNSGDDSIDDEEEAYVHEAFLGDWRPGSELRCSKLREEYLHGDILPHGGNHIREQLNNYGSGESQSQNNNMQEFPATLKDSQHPHKLSHFTYIRNCASNTMKPNHLVPDLTLKPFKTPFCLRPYRVHRTNSAHLVKLAPDLTPVNLPPSARVISQSAFKSYQCEPSATVSVVGGGNNGIGIENVVPKVPRVAKLGTIHSATKGNKNYRLKKNIANSHQEESGVLKDKCVMEEKATEPDLQMHPLLFKAPENECLPYCPLNCSSSTPNSFSFFSGNQPQVNLSLFCNPQQENSTVNCFDKSLKSKETTSMSCGIIGFHPLLQRTDDVSSDLVNACSTVGPSVDFESSRGKYAQLRNSSDAVQTKSQVNSGPSTFSANPSSPNERANELDLEIHLSSTSRKEKVVASRDLIEHTPIRSGALDSGTMVETQNSNNQYYQSGEICPGVSSKLVADSPTLVKPRNTNSRYSIENMGDQSFPGIVMEQEELSDSDEEMGEHVEFEHEEMADSEGEEGSDCEQISEIQYKEAPNFAMEKVLTNADCDDQQSQPRAYSNLQGNVCIPVKHSTTSFNSGMTGHGKDMTSISSWLSLDSCAPGCPVRAKPKPLGTLNAAGPTAKSLGSRRPNRSCKKTTLSTKRVTVQKNAMDTKQQPSLTSMAVAPLRKPRKLACKTDLDLNRGLTVENSYCVGNDKFG